MTALDPRLRAAGLSLRDLKAAWHYRKPGHRAGSRQVGIAFRLRLGSFWTIQRCPISESTGTRSWRKLADGFTERFKTCSFRVCGRETTPHEVRVCWCNLVDHLGKTIETDSLAKQRVKKMIARLGAQNWATFSKAHLYDAEQWQAMREYCT